MVHILAKRHIHTLAEFAASNVLLAFDYDGTLAPTVANPTAARMRPRTRRLLTAVARRYPCVVISGRARDDVVRRLGRIPVRHVSGNHGVEPWAQEELHRTRVGNWVHHLRQELGCLAGVAVEDKKYSLTVHFRNAPQKRRTAKAVVDALRGLRHVRALVGKDAISLLPRGSADKGIALDIIRRRLLCDTAIYLGDDQTDEDAFGAGDPKRLLGIRVSRSARSRARFFVRNQEEVDELLGALLAFRLVRQPRRPAS